MAKKIRFYAVFLILSLMYSCVGEKTSIPSLSTNEVSEISNTTAISGGEIISDGGDPVTVMGVCWNHSGKPTLLDDNTVDSSTTGKFLSKMTGLKSNTTYYVRAFAMNIAGTAYGDEQIFTTLDVLPANDTKNILAYWNMDNVMSNLLVDYKDQSPGQIFGCLPAQGKVNNCLSFNGGGNYVRIRDSNLLDSIPEFSLLVWIKAEQPSSHAVIYSNVQEITPSNGFGLYLMRYGPESFNLQSFDRSIRFFSEQTDMHSKSKISYGEWTHVAITYRKNVGKIFINGKLDNEGFINTPLANQIDQCIGASYTPYYFYKGLIDELKILNISLDESAVAEAYKSEAGSMR